MTAKLLPCPFCDSDKINGAFIRDGWRVGCMECGAGVQAYNPEAHKRAAEKWNRRASPTEPRLDAGNQEDPDSKLVRKIQDLIWEFEPRAAIECIAEHLGHWSPAPFTSPNADDFPMPPCDDVGLANLKGKDDRDH